MYQLLVAKPPDQKYERQRNPGHLYTTQLRDMEAQVFEEQLQRHWLFVDERLSIRLGGQTNKVLLC